MRLLTRSDFDGLACAVLLKEAGVIDSWKFVHPKDLQDGLVEVTENDCLANVPYVKGCGLWFDHHSSEEERAAYGNFEGESRKAPSCASVIYDYYGARERFWNYLELINAVDKVDSANLKVDEILDPKGWVLLGFIMDPRTGLGRFKEFAVSNYQLMEKMIGWCDGYTIDEILEMPDVVERIKLYREQSDMFKDMVRKYTRISGDTIITDLRDVNPIYAGNRFMIYSLYPEQNLSVWIVNTRNGGCSAAVGHSVIDRSSPVDVGKLMLKYGGGGHPQVGTCQFAPEIMDEKLEELLAEIDRLNVKA